MAQESQPPTINSRGKRNLRYGANVVISIVAALGIVVMVNWIGNRRFVRLDQTATRRYSLSEQTLKVLQGLEGQYRIVTLFSGSSTYLQQAQDLIDEYGHYGDGMAVEHLNTDFDIQRIEQFLVTVRQRYQDQTQPLEAAINDARDAVSQVREALPSMVAPLQEVLQSPALEDGELKQTLTAITQALTRLDGDLKDVDDQVQRGMSGAVPQYGDAKDLLTTIFGDLDGKLFAIAHRRCEQATNDPSVPPDVKDGLLRLLKVLSGVHHQIQTAAKTLDTVQIPPEYETLTTQLSIPDIAVIMGADKVRILPLTEMFREPDPNQTRQGDRPDLRFQGEEKLTGTLVSMSMEHLPLVVFVTTGGEVAGPRGPFEQVANRLRALNFQVEEWSPISQPGPMGQMAPPQSPPTPSEGQRVVWIVLPVPPPNPMNPMTAGAEMKIAEYLKSMLDDGGAAMVMLAASPMPSFAANPLAEILTDWGITPQLDRIVLREVVLPNDTKRASSQLDLAADAWPEQLPLTSALNGMPAVFLQASPLVLGQPSSEEHQIWPIATIQGDDIWSEQEFLGSTPPELDPVTAGKPYTIAAAGQKGQARLITVADPAWATNQVVTYGPLGPGSADILGSTFPGNAELFVNGVCWLAHLDELIATGARTQDIRRIGAMSRAELNGVRWALLLGMPLAVMFAGVGVWSVRRSG